MTPPLIRVEITTYSLTDRKLHSVQTVPAESINFKKRTKTFKYLNQNKRWKKGEIDIDADLVFYCERERYEN